MASLEHGSLLRVNCHARVWSFRDSCGPHPHIQIVFKWLFEKKRCLPTTVPAKSEASQLTITNILFQDILSAWVVSNFASNANK